MIHLAAEVGGIGANRKRPGRFFYTNMTMVNLIEEGRKYNRLKKFLQVGTVCAYPKFAPVPFREQVLWDGYPVSALTLVIFALIMLSSRLNVLDHHLVVLVPITAVVVVLAFQGLIERSLTAVRMRHIFHVTVQRSMKPTGIWVLEHC